MSYVLTIEPDALQASALQRVLSKVVGGNLTVVDSAEAALAAIDRQVPDLVLLHPLMSPGDDDHLVAYLGTLPRAGHVQVIRIPRLQLSSARRSTRGVLGRLREQRSITAECDPQVFAEDVASYLALAYAHREELEWRQAYRQMPMCERRRAPRWAGPDVPWIASVQLAAGERADLVDLSCGGALVRTDRRPQLLSIRGGGPDEWIQRGLTLRLISGEQVRVPGEIIRCRIAPIDDTITYHVALRFDESIDLYLPEVWLPGALQPSEMLNQWS